MDGSELVLVQTAPTTPLPRKSLLVATTPEAYEVLLLAHGYPPAVIDDLVDRPGWLVDPSEHALWLDGWYREVEASTRYPGAARSARQLLTAPVDSVCTTATMLRELIERVDACAVRWIDRPRRSYGPWHNGHLQFSPLLGDRPLMGELAPALGQAMGIPVRVQEVEGAPMPQSAAPSRTSVRPGLAALRPWGARVLGPARRTRPTRPPKRDIGTEVFSWYAGYGIADLHRTAARERRRVLYLQRGGSITRLVDPLRPWRQLHEPVSCSPMVQAHSVASAPAELLESIGQHCKVPGAGEVLESRLSFFLDAIVPVVDEGASRMAPALEQLGVDSVSFANPSSIEEFILLEAATRVGCTRRLYQHGDHLMPYDAWAVSETHMMDELVVSDPTVPADLSAACGRLDVQPPRFRSDNPRSRPPHRRRVADSRARVVAYVPSFLTGSSWVIGGGYFEDTWYHRWHRQLLEQMGEHLDVQFMWKALPRADQSIDPMPQLIMNGPPNVTFESRQFAQVIDSIDATISDFPSSSLFESVRAGLPTLALSFERFATLRPAATDLLSPIVTRCSDTQAAIAAIDRFLAADPSTYLVDGRAAGLT